MVETLYILAVQDENWLPSWAKSHLATA